MKTCAKTDCEVGVSPGHVLCRRHWLSLPTSRRDVLVEAFRQRVTEPALFAAAVVLTAELVNA